MTTNLEMCTQKNYLEDEIKTKLIVTRREFISNRPTPKEFLKVVL